MTDNPSSNQPPRQLSVLDWDWVAEIGKGAVAGGVAAGIASLILPEVNELRPLGYPFMGIGAILGGLVGAIGGIFPRGENDSTSAHEVGAKR